MEVYLDGCELRELDPVTFFIVTEMMAIERECGISVVAPELTFDDGAARSWRAPEIAWRKRNGHFMPDHVIL